MTGTISTDEVRALSEASDLDLSMYRPAHVEARVTRTMASVDAGDIATLESLVGSDDAVRAEFRRSVAISVTGFFRDPEQFALLEPFLAALHDLERPRIWSAGCSTGRELWTMAVLMDRLGLAGRSQFLGSDILTENIVEARRGLTDAELDGHALPQDARLQFEVRDIVREGPPGHRWDVVVCRNMAIYLEPTARQGLHEMLAGCLNPGGLLLLGRSERLSSPRALGMTLLGPHLYRKALA
ncbi:MAG: CheR family methyltransferase [Solirubrobacteraceae bacterium]|nr:CheR family methyltransferase [Solirubrobacteraceae bacterium]